MALLGSNAGKIERVEIYEMPEFSGRNILVFSDGTGQAGGVQVDEFRSNVYKLFRATRCGPDSQIDPDRQLAFYDPGLGSKLAGEDIKVGPLRRIYNGCSSATGLGITRNIIDCYSALITLWRPGDRIFLFGFSRGAYTARCLGGVLGLCGIPTAMPDGTDLLRNRTAVRKIASEAVKRVYRHGSGTDDKGQAAVERKKRLGAQRLALGEQFRRKYNASGPLGPNVVPHFIGVWDTVAAVGLSPPAATAMRAVVLIVWLTASGAAAWHVAGGISAQFYWVFAVSLFAAAILSYVVYFSARIKFALRLPGYKWYQTLHLVSFKMAFFDRSLNPHVRYARHALAIDEARADFDRVPWKNDSAPPNREISEGAWFKQLWFAGNHSDIGGSYPENESRLSDIALEWMVDQAKRSGLLVDERYLRLFGRPTGQQHDEVQVGIKILGLTFRWRTRLRDIQPNATLHPSVLQRFKEPEVQIYDREVPYRPPALADHELLKEFYD